MAGRKRNQVREALERDGVAGPHESSDGVFETEKLSHESYRLPVVSARTLPGSAHRHMASDQ